MNETPWTLPVLVVIMVILLVVAIVCAYQGTQEGDRSYGQLANYWLISLTSAAMALAVLITIWLDFYPNIG